MRSWFPLFEGSMNVFVGGTPRATLFLHFEGLLDRLGRDGNDV